MLEPALIQQQRELLKAFDQAIARRVEEEEEAELQLRQEEQLANDTLEAATSKLERLKREAESQLILEQSQLEQGLEGSLHEAESEHFRIRQKIEQTYGHKRQELENKRIQDEARVDHAHKGERATAHAPVALLEGELQRSERTLADAEYAVRFHHSSNLGVIAISIHAQPNIEKSFLSVQRHDPLPTKEAEELMLTARQGLILEETSYSRAVLKEAHFQVAEVIREIETKYADLYKFRGRDIRKLGLFDSDLYRIQEEIRSEHLGAGQFVHNENVNIANLIKSIRETLKLVRMENLVPDLDDIAPADMQILESVTASDIEITETVTATLARQEAEKYRRELQSGFLTIEALVQPLLYSRGIISRREMTAFHVDDSPRILPALFFLIVLAVSLFVIFSKFV